MMRFFGLLVLLSFPVSAREAAAAQTAPQQSAPGLSQSLTQTLSAAASHVPWKVTFGDILLALILFIAALLVLRYLTRIMELIAERWNNLRLVVKRLIPIVRVTGWTIIGYVIIKAVFAPPIETLLALTASAGIAIGLASQDVLKNILGGIIILFDRPFQVGDKIQVGTYYGEVVHIGLRTVRVVTPDDSRVSIPNSQIVNASVSNANSGEFSCQVVAELYLPPAVDVLELRRIAERVAAVSRYVAIEKPIMVVTRHEVNHGRPLLHVRVKAYVFDLRYEFQFASDMTERTLRELARRGILDEAHANAGTFDMAGAAGNELEGK
jgi:small-conductance mechanosensitive channel